VDGAQRHEVAEGDGPVNALDAAIRKALTGLYPALARMHLEAREAASRFAAEGNVDVSWERLWFIPPAPFHPELIAFADEAIRETCGASHRLPSGPLHDAAEMSMAGIPTVMLFVQSLKGISHNKIEDTRLEHLDLAVRALDRLAEQTMRWVTNGERSH
jgi:N-carbamoyl-L-amino-acid hydrolase